MGAHGAEGHRARGGRQDGLRLSEPVRLGSRCLDYLSVRCEGERQGVAKVPEEQCTQFDPAAGSTHLSARVGTPALSIRTGSHAGARSLGTLGLRARACRRAASLRQGARPCGGFGRNLLKRALLSEALLRHFQRTLNIRREKCGWGVVTDRYAKIHEDAFSPPRRGRP